MATQVTYAGTVAPKVVQDDATYLMHTYGRLPVELVDGKGAVLKDALGNEYLDFLGGIGCASLGHCNPVLVKAISEQLGKVWQTGNYFYDSNRNEFARELAELLATTTDEEGHVTGSTGEPWQIFMSNSGAESNECSIKLARMWGEKHLGGAYTILTAKKSFHGRTLATLAATAQDRFQAHYQPLPQGFPSVALNDIDALEAAFANPESVGGPICAVMLECIQGESGVWPASKEYLKAIERLCHENGALMIVDEVQTGVYRTGAPFSFMLSGVKPDIVSIAKGIGGGFPMGACGARAEVAACFEPGDHGTTFGGNALASVAGKVALETLVHDNMGEHVIEVGNHLAQKLSELPHVVEVRGAGLMRGAQFDVPIANDLVLQGLAHGLILNHIGDSILRFLPPLVVSTEQVDEMCARLTSIIKELTE